MNTLFLCLMFIISTILALRTMYEVGKDVRNLEILKKMEPIVNSQGQWKDVGGDPYQDGYFQGREDALNEVLDLFWKDKVVETNE